MSLLRLRLTVYANPKNATGRAVREALEARFEGTVSAAVERALRNLEALYEQKAGLPDVKRAERSVAEAWAKATSALDKSPKARRPRKK